MRNFVSSLRNRFNLRCQNLIIWLGVEIASYRFKFSVSSQCSSHSSYRQCILIYDFLSSHDLEAVKILKIYFWFMIDTSKVKFLEVMLWMNKRFLR